MSVGLGALRLGATALVPADGAVPRRRGVVVAVGLAARESRTCVHPGQGNFSPLSGSELHFENSLRHEQPISPSRLLRRGASRGSAGRSDACMTGSGTQACCCCGSSRVGKSGSTCAAQALSRLLGVCYRARRALNRSIEGRNACGVWAALVVRHGRLVLLGAPLGVDARLAVLCRRRHTALALGEVV